MCYFNESKFPVKPWPNFCREWVHDDPCSTYQIDPKSTWIPSCVISTVAGQCPEVDKIEPYTCMMSCDTESGCVATSAV